MASVTDEQLEQHYEREVSRKRRAGLGSEAEDEQRDAQRVATHYNSLADRHRTLTEGSNILYLRNLHNWIKSVLIGNHMQRGWSVLDLACGKGGDMTKFKAGGCAKYVGVDIALRSVRDAVGRYNGGSGREGMPFDASFIVADFCNEELQGALPPGLTFHLVSCQFALHYSFSSEARALSLLRNAACHLQPGGFFVGTLPDARVLVKRLRESPGLEFGNQHYHVTFSDAHASKRFPARSPFGIAYHFTLTEAVDDCQEYLVPIPVLRDLAARVGLQLEYVVNFTDFFAAEYRNHGQLLRRMNVLPMNGSISEDEWEVAHSYAVFAFKKLPAPGEVVRPLAPLPLSRHAYFAEARIVQVAEVTGRLEHAALPSPTHLGDNATEAHLACAHSAPRELQMPSPPRDEGETRAPVRYVGNELFDDEDT